MDKRQRRTRAAILEACVALLQEKDFQKITIREIVERAGINRGTFYLHFADKYDMVDSFENEMIEKIERAIVDNLPKEPSGQLFLQSRYDTIVQILTCYQENKELLQFLLQSSYFSFQSKLRKRLKSVFNERVLPNLEKMQYDFPVKYVDFFIIAFTSVSLSLADYAYQTKTPIQIEETAKLLFNLLLQGPAKTFGLLQDEDA